MRITIPISSADVHLLPEFLLVLEKFGGLQGHRITIIPQQSQMPQAHDACARLSKICKSVEVIGMGVDLPPNNWPVSCNQQFFFACQQMPQLGMPWFWMELDALPIKEGWAGELAGEYNAAGKAFLGNINPATEMMMGVAVYHPNTRNESLVNDLQRSCDLPFDEYLKWAFKLNGYANSEILCDMWNTVNYRMEGGNMVCDPGPDREMPSRKRGGIVPATAYVVHGCKDGSLPRLLLGEAVPASGNEVVSPVIEVKQPETITPSYSKPVDVVKFLCVADAWWHSLPLEDRELIMMNKDNEDSENSWLMSELATRKIRFSEFAKRFRITNEAAKKKLLKEGFTITGPGWVNAPK